jgi:hypothetical protein
MEETLRFFENRMFRKVFGPEKDEINRERRLCKEEIYDLHSSPNIIWVTNSRRMRRVRHKAQMGDRRGANSFWWKNLGNRDNL